VHLVTLNCAELYHVELSSGDLSVLPTVTLNFENLVAKVLPIRISSAAMVKEKGRLIGIRIFELDEHFSTHCCISGIVSSLIEDSSRPLRC
jgi:hypothetical protein